MKRVTNATEDAVIKVYVLIQFVFVVKDLQEKNVLQRIKIF